MKTKQEKKKIWEELQTKMNDLELSVAHLEDQKVRLCELARSAQKHADLRHPYGGEL